MALGLKDLPDRYFTRSRLSRATERFAVDLGMMALVDGGVVAAQPDAADRKAAIYLAFRYAGFLKQR
jgi:hypothetical protein